MDLNIKENINKYFNRKAFWGGPGLYTTMFSAFTAFNLAAGTTGSLAIGAFTAVLAAASLNKWQEQATGKALWQPRIWERLGL